MPDPHTEEQASLYVLGILEPEEAQAFRARLKREPDLARLVRDLEDTAATIALEPPPVRAPGGSLSGILSRIREEDSGGTVSPFPLSGRNALGWLAAAGWAAAAALAITFGLVNLGIVGEDPDRGPRPGREITGDPARAAGTEDSGGSLRLRRLETELERLEERNEALEDFNLALLADNNALERRAIDMEIILRDLSRSLGGPTDLQDPGDLRDFVATVGNLSPGELAQYAGPSTIGEISALLYENPAQVANILSLPLTAPGDSPEDVSLTPFLLSLVAGQEPGFGSAGIDEERNANGNSPDRPQRSVPPGRTFLTDDGEFIVTFTPPEKLGPREEYHVYSMNERGEILSLGAAEAIGPGGSTFIAAGIFDTSAHIPATPIITRRPAGAPPEEGIGEVILTGPRIVLEENDPGLSADREEGVPDRP